jgi:hypothetical protein
MLRAMTIPGAAVGLLLAAGLALGVLLAMLLPAARDRRRGRPPPPTSPPRGFPDDDLPGFLATPPGSDGKGAVPRSGWAVLSAPPGPPPAPATPPRLRIGRPALIAGLAALVLLAAFVAVVATADPRRPVPGTEHRPAPNAARLPAVPTAPASGAPGAGVLAATDLPAGRHGVTADLTFTGIVLERRAVGVTAAYPHVRISDDGSASLAHVRLVTFNCLADAAPADPVAAGCSRVVPEYAELPSPALQVTRSRAGGLALRGRFPTYVRPNGTPAVWTGEVYELRIEVSPTTAERAGTEVPATGFLQLGDDRARTTTVSVLRPGH